MRSRSTDRPKNPYSLSVCHSFSLSLNIYFSLTSLLRFLLPDYLLQLSISQKLDFKNFLRHWQESQYHESQFQIQLYTFLCLTAYGNNVFEPILHTRKIRRFPRNNLLPLPSRCNIAPLQPPRPGRQSPAPAARPPPWELQMIPWLMPREDTTYIDL